MGGSASKTDANTAGAERPSRGRRYVHKNMIMQLKGNSFIGFPASESEIAVDDNDSRCPKLFSACWGKEGKKENSPIYNNSIKRQPLITYKAKGDAFLECEKTTRNLECRKIEVEDIEPYFSIDAIVHEGLYAEQELFRKYEICEVLGVGTTSTCHKCINLDTGQKFACKIIGKGQEKDQFHNELATLRFLNHPNIIKLKEAYKISDKIYMITELVDGGELFDYVVQKGTLDEDEAVKIVWSIASALVYLHSMNVIHRDLKPENLLIQRKLNFPGDVEVKIIDFGLAKQLSEPVTSTFTGTCGYLAPEMLQGKDYCGAVDIWALGVIAFVLLCGCLPFDNDEDLQCEDAQKRSFVLIFPRSAKKLSDSAKDLISHLLDVNPNTRYTAKQALEHPWMMRVHTRNKISLQKNRFKQATPPTHGQKLSNELSKPARPPHRRSSSHGNGSLNSNADNRIHADSNGSRNRVRANSSGSTEYRNRVRANSSGSTEYRRRGIPMESKGNFGKRMQSRKVSI